MKLLIVGNRSGTNIAGSFERAARAAGIETRVVESRHAMEAPFWLRQANWRLRGKRPTHLSRFGRAVVELCEQWRPDAVVAVGTAPIPRPALDRIAGLGIPTVNYLTDDPWNRAHRARWFLEALPGYRCIASPRRSNLRDLAALGCPRVEYLPFGYDPELHFPDPAEDEEERTALAADVVFVGGADRDRIPFLRALLASGLDVAVYGSYWERYRATRRHTRGQTDPARIRRATTTAKVSLCLVRRANRDGHVMRSFEIPASGGCMLAEDTREHRDIFGPHGEAVLYFRDPRDAVEQARRLVRSPEMAKRLADEAGALVRGGGNTYAARLRTILEWVGTDPPSPVV